MVVSPELLAVVAAALQISPAAVMAVVTAAVTRTITVALPLPTRLLGRAASPALQNKINVVIYEIETCLQNS